MKYKKIILCLCFLLVFVGCSKNEEDKDIDLSKELSLEGSEDLSIEFDTYDSFSADGQFKLTIIDTSIRDFTEIEDRHIIDRIKNEAEGKYVIFVDYVFEDLTIDNEFYMSSYKMGDLMPKLNKEDGSKLKLVSANNETSETIDLKDNEELLRAIFVSEEKLGKVDLSFVIKDKLGEKTEYANTFDLD